MKTKSGKKFVPVRSYTQKRDGLLVFVRQHIRSAPALTDRVLSRDLDNGYAFVTEQRVRSA